MSDRVGQFLHRKFCTQHDIGLIVMGSHGHGALRNLALGSFADVVLRNTRGPVTVVR